MEVKTTFATRLKELREAKNMNCTQLAKKLGVSSASLGYYERSERVPDIEILSKICKFFNVSADYLLGISNAYSIDLSTQAICQEIGCSEEALNGIKSLYNFDMPGCRQYELFLNTFYSFDAKNSDDKDFFDIVSYLYCHMINQMALLESKKEFDDKLKQGLQNGTFNGDFEGYLKIRDEVGIHDSEEQVYASEWKLIKVFMRFIECMSNEYERAWRNKWQV